MNSKLLRSYLLAGLVVWLPILVTFVVLRFIVDLLDKTLSLLPFNYQPEQVFGFHVPGLGVILSLFLLLLTGLIATNFLGQRLVAWSEAVLDRIPLVRTIYNGAKQMIQAIFVSNGHAFRKVLLVEYPSAGIWSLAFQTGIVDKSITQHTGVEMVSLFIPTTPNPTSGFLLMKAKSEVKELAMSVDDALKLIISLGVMGPTSTV